MIISSFIFQSISRQQTTDVDKTVLQTIKSIIAQDGIQGLWKGLKASLVLCSNPAITYGAFERLKTEVASRKGPGVPFTSGEIFVLGALSKTLATVVTYPYIMAKVRLQWKPPQQLSDSLSKEELELIKYRSAFDVLRKVYRSEGLIGWYKV